MIGVRKNSGVIRLLMAAALVLFVAACSSSSNNSGIERERDQALETVEELEGTVVDLTGSVEELMGQLAALQESGTDAAQEKIEMLEARIAELEGIEQDVVDEAARKAEEASVLALFKGLDPASNGADDTAGSTLRRCSPRSPYARKGYESNAGSPDGSGRPVPNNKLANIAKGTLSAACRGLGPALWSVPRTRTWHRRHRHGRRRLRISQPDEAVRPSSEVLSIL